ncbi:unnamed protein product, partial [Prorocentrum cordatum]
DSNGAILGSMKEQAHGRDILAEPVADNMLGAMGPLELLDSLPTDRLPIYSGYLEFSWVAFVVAGIKCPANHYAMPFGATSAACAWHRTGSFLPALVRELCHGPAASKQGVNITRGACLEVFASLLGLPVDAAKSAQSVMSLLALGAKVACEMAICAASIAASPGKKDKWAEQMSECLASGICDAGIAAKLAGCFCWAATVSVDKVGGAFIAPFHAQS